MHIQVAPASNLFPEPKSNQIVPATASGRLNAAKKTPQVTISALQYRVCWFACMLLHVICVVYYIMAGYVYFYLPKTVCFVNIQIAYPEMDPKFFPIVGVVYWVFATMHLAGILRIIYHSFHHRRLLLAGPPDSNSSSDKSMLDRFRAVLAGYCCCGPLQQAWDALTRLADAFGIHSDCFEITYVGKEVVQVALQTLQAYRMSQLLPRRWLNLGYVVVLVFNCWSGLLVRFAVKASSGPARRLLYLSSDLLLDMVSALIIPSALLLPYILRYDPTLTDFSVEDIFNVEFMLSIANESRLVFVSNPIGLISKIAFSLGLFSGLEVIKPLLTTTLPRTEKAEVRPVQIHGSSVLDSRGAAHSSRSSSLASFRNAVVNNSDRLTHILHVLLAIWGLGIAVLSGYAESHSSPGFCRVALRPWFTSMPGCALFEYDCRLRSDSDAALRGHADELTAVWETADPASVSWAVIRHCDEVEVPSWIQRFENLVGFKTFNVTITSWDSAAALHSSMHSQIIYLYLVHTQFPSGRLPEGLLAEDFPATIGDVELSTTNLEALPDDLPTKWPAGMGLILENCKFPRFPRVLLDMNLFFLAFYRANFSEVPVEVFQSTSLVYFIIVHSPDLVQLPEVPSGTVTTAMQILVIRLTGIRTLPAWITQDGDGFLAQGKAVFAHGTPLCEAIESGNETALAPSLLGQISCAPSVDHYYPVEYEN